MKKFTMVMTAVSLSALVLAGCGDGADTTESTVSSAQEETQETETEEAKVYPEDAYLDNLNVDDYLELGDYLGLEVSVDAVNVTDEDIDTYIDSVLENHKENQEITGRAAQDGDVTNIDYVGKKDGVEFDGGSDEGAELTLGSNTFIDGFEDGIIGMEVGETKDLELTFPENYGNTELAGADVVFTVTLNGIYEKVKPELNDDFVAGLSLDGVSTVDEYRDYVEKQLLESAQSQHDTEVESAVLNAVLNNTTFKAEPEAMGERYYDRLVSNMTYQAAMYGLDLDTFMLYISGMEAEDYEPEMKDSAMEAVKQILALQAIAEKEGMTVSDEDVEKDIEERAAQYGYESADAYKEALGDEVKGYREMLVVEKISAYLVENAVVTDIAPAAEEETATEETLTEETAETESETAAQETTEAE